MKLAVSCLADLRTPQGSALLFVPCHEKVYFMVECILTRIPLFTLGSATSVVIPNCDLSHTLNHNYLCHVNIFVILQSRFFFAWSQALAGISLALSGPMASPPRSCDRVDDDHIQDTCESLRPSKKN